MAKNHLFCLLFSSGTPMILGGDEFLRTQRGNNNAYCQDNEISWFDWTLVDRNANLINFVRKSILFRSQHQVLQRTRFFSGRDTDLDGIPDLSWYNDRGETIDWNSDAKTIGYLLDGSESSTNGQEYLLYFVLNSDHNDKDIYLPDPPESYTWHRIIDTGANHPVDFPDSGDEEVLGGKVYRAKARSNLLFKTKKP
jgi:isoamylase